MKSQLEFEFARGVHSDATFTKAPKRVRWSYSRRSLLEQCPRRYYYSYYGANRRTAYSEAQKQELHFLNTLQNRYERTGQILHLVVATFFRKAKAGEFWSPSRLSTWATHLFTKDIEYSINYANNDLNFEKEQSRGLLSEFYCGDMASIKHCDEAKERLVLAIDSFSNNSIYSTFRDSAISHNPLVEYRMRLSTLPCNIEGQIDLAYREGDKVTIVDWKLGGDNSGRDSLQLTAYAIWACEYFSVAPSLIKLYKAHLSSGKLSQSELTSDSIKRGTARIFQDAERISMMDVYGREGLAEAFSPCSQVAICMLCPFRQVCPEGKLLKNVGD